MEAIAILAGSGSMRKSAILRHVRSMARASVQAAACVMSCAAPSPSEEPPAERPCSLWMCSSSASALRCHGTPAGGTTATAVAGSSWDGASASCACLTCHRGRDVSYGQETRLNSIPAIWASLGIIRLASEVSRDMPKGTNTPFGLWVWHRASRQSASHDTCVGLDVEKQTYIFPVLYLPFHLLT